MLSLVIRICRRLFFTNNFKFQFLTQYVVVIFCVFACWKFFFSALRPLFTGGLKWNFFIVQCLFIMIFYVPRNLFITKKLKFQILTSWGIVFIFAFLHAENTFLPQWNPSKNAGKMLNIFMVQCHFWYVSSCDTSFVLHK